MGCHVFLRRTQRPLARMPTPKNAPPPPVRAARNIVAEVRAGARFEAALLTESPHCGTRAPQVVHTAHAALDDVCKLYSVDPRSNPAVSTQRPPPTLSRRFALTNTKTHSLPLPGDGCDTQATEWTSCESATCSSDSTPSTLRHGEPPLAHSATRLPATQSTDTQRRVSPVSQLGHLDGQDDVDDVFVARTCASRAAALKRLDDLWGCAFPWEPVSCAADAARIAAQHALDTAHVAVATASEREARACVSAAAQEQLRQRADQAMAQLLTALQVADGFAQDAAVALARADEREQAAIEAAGKATQLAADNMALLRRCVAAEEELAVLREERQEWADDAEGRRSAWKAAQEKARAQAQARAEEQIAQARADSAASAAAAQTAIRDLEAARAAAAESAESAALCRDQADLLAQQLADAHAATAAQAASAAASRSECDTLAKQVRLLSAALADATVQLARRQAADDVAKEHLDAAQQAMAAAHGALEEEEATPVGVQPTHQRTHGDAETLRISEGSTTPERRSSSGFPSTPALRQLAAEVEAAHARASRSGMAGAAGGSVQDDDW